MAGMDSSVGRATDAPRAYDTESGAFAREESTFVLQVPHVVVNAREMFGELRFPSWTIWTAILVGWGIALFEYCFAVPPNRIGYAHGFTGGQLKIIQEIITLSVFAVFGALVL